MYKLLVFKEVAIAGWCYDHETKSKFADGYLVFFREFSIPFAPYIGLQFSAETWLPGPLVGVRYDIESQKFICHVSEDNEIPNNLDSFMERGNRSEEEIEKYIEEEIKFKKQLYLGLGWKVYKH